jgi:peroxin-4
LALYGLLLFTDAWLKTGEICLDLLKTAWTPAYTLKMTVEAIWQMLAAPGIDSPLNVDIAALIRQGDRVGSEALVRWGCGEWRWDSR